jgi:hypothetical protein
MIAYGPIAMTLQHQMKLILIVLVMIVTLVTSISIFILLRFMSHHDGCVVLYTVQESTTTSNTSRALHHIVPVTGIYMLVAIDVLLSANHCVFLIASGTSPPLIAPPWVEVQIWRSVFG